MLHDVTDQELRAILVWMLRIPSTPVWGATKAVSKETAFSYAPEWARTNDTRFLNEE